MPDTVALRTPGPLLRRWREHRRLSQLGLALLADTSARHLSFVETGRSRPSRELILRLGEKLEMPLRERNQVLLAGGFAPEFPEHPLGDTALTDARRAVELVLAGHEPSPALAVDRHWTLVSANHAAMQLLGGVDPAQLTPPINALRLSLHPQGLAPNIVNLAEWRAHILERLRHQVEATADPHLRELAAELAGYAGGGPPAATRTGLQSSIIVPLQLRTEHGVLAFFSTTTVFGMPRDVTLEELAIESFFPANVETAEVLRTLSRGQST